MPARNRNDWNTADRTYIRTVFSQPGGQKFLRLVKEAIPKITATKLEEVSVEALKKQGAEDLFEVLVALAGDVEPEFREGRDFIDLSKEGD